eukprot:TRINITY_DN4012_c0_g1_i9.p1 TRINITY_DN4012_c0_g1~~TRINITY_DN4012_c0_g1_i9.p1  ORF type:complete len:117 (+),score=35.18 TRINITY_DN4012_c0_g1_i9:49-399(+)
MCHHLRSKFFFFLMIRRPPRSTLSSSSAASDVYKRQSKYWALAIPAFISISVIYYVVACVSLSHAAAAPLWSKSTLTDEHSYPEVLPEEQAAAGPLPIPPHSDIPMAKVNMILGFR